jgi:rare lipoprotein A (peptidoglycan hydrolase)
LIGLAPAGSNAGGPFGLASEIVPGTYRSMLKVAARVCEMQIEVGHTAIMSAVLSHDTKLVAGPLARPEREPAKMPPQETMRAASVAGSTVYQGTNRPALAPGTVTRGVATWYGGVDGFDLGDGMADGTPFNPDDPMIAAGNRWPLGTRLMVCHGERCIPVCVRDRGGFGHAVDLSRAAFALLAPLSSGVIDVTIEASP